MNATLVGGLLMITKGITKVTLTGSVTKDIAKVATHLPMGKNHFWI